MGTAAECQLFWGAGLGDNRACQSLVVTTNACFGFSRHGHFRADKARNKSQAVIPPLSPVLKFALPVQTQTLVLPSLHLHSSTRGNGAVVRQVLRAAAEELRNSADATCSLKRLWKPQPLKGISHTGGGF